MRLLKLGVSGTDVMEIQALLKKTGYNPGPIDGIYGPKTEEAVVLFQRDNGILADGMVGSKTFRKMEPLLLGYDTYIIQPGDTFKTVASKYYTSVKKVIAANPTLDPMNLRVGQRITVPYGIDIVDTNIDYTYEIMRRDIRGLKARYPFLEVTTPGRSVLGRNLYTIKLGTGPNKVFYNGAHHALEWITTPLLMKFIENFSKAYAEGQSIRGYSTEDIWNQSTIYIMPMVNPDGVNLVLNGLQRDNPYYNQLLQWNNTGQPFSQVWSANIRGVDLNHNYDALFYEYKKLASDLGYDGPSPKQYPGVYPESEPESKTVANFTRANNFRLVLAYHSQGEVIYWNFQNLAPPEARKIADMFSDVSGYAVEETYGTASYSGYKDWFIQDYVRPGYTIEVGRGVNPLPISQFDQIYANNEELLLLASVV